MNEVASRQMQTQKEDRFKILMATIKTDIEERIGREHKRKG